VPLTPVHDIINNPHPVYKCRAFVRVVDYWPKDLQNFSKSWADPDYNDAPSTQTSMESQGWEWFFYLLVEDVDAPKKGEPEYLKLLVAVDDAVHLLKLDAGDLTSDKGKLKRLEDCLWTLCGNVQELKANHPNYPKEGPAPSNKPFTCCIAATVNKGKPVHSLFGTTLLVD
jgi:hypothetical protein